MSVNENDIFAADITEKNEVENVRFKKSLEYAVTGRINVLVYGLSINEDIDSALVTVTEVDRQNFLSNTIQKLVKEK